MTPFLCSRDPSAPIPRCKTIAEGRTIAYITPMTIRPILIHPDPRLKKPADPVTTFDAALKELAEDMLATMYDAPGIGLAAPQVGVNKRLFVWDIGEGPFAMIIPEVRESDGE